MELWRWHEGKEECKNFNFRVGLVYLFKSSSFLRRWMPGQFHFFNSLIRLLDVERIRSQAPSRKKWKKKLEAFWTNLITQEPGVSLNFIQAITNSHRRTTSLGADILEIPNQNYIKIYSLIQKHLHAKNHPIRLVIDKAGDSMFDEY